MDILTYTSTRLPHNAPIPRSSTALARINQTLFSFGGFSQLYHSDLNSTDPNSSIPQWLPRQRQQLQPPVRRGHTLSNYGSSKFVLFGGDSQNKFLNDTWIFNGNWQRLECENAPPGRYGHSSVILGDFLLVFGGKNPQIQALFDDFWRLDLITLKWEKLSSTGPTGRYGATLTQISENRAILFGGKGSSGRVNDLWEIDQTGSLKLLALNNVLEIAPRTEHGACHLVGSFLAVFGGSGDNAPLGDLWVVDCASCRCWKLDVGEVSERHAFGYCEFRIQSGMGSVKQLSGEYKMGGKLVLEETDENEVFTSEMVEMYIFGGFNNQKLGDLHKISFMCLKKANSDEIKNYIKNDQISAINATSMQFQQQIQNFKSDQNIDELSVALEEFQTSVVEAFTSLLKRVSNVESSQVQQNQIQGDIQEQLTELDSGISEFIQNQQITSLKQRVYELQRGKDEVEERLERIEKMLLQSNVLECGDKIQLISGDQITMIEEQSILEDRLKEIDEKCMQNSVVQIQKINEEGQLAEEVQDDIQELRDEIQGDVDLDEVDRMINELE